MGYGQGPEIRPEVNDENVALSALEVESKNRPQVVDVPRLPVTRPGHIAGKLLLEMRDEKLPSAADLRFERWRIGYAEVLQAAAKVGLEAAKSIKGRICFPFAPAIIMSALKLLSMISAVPPSTSFAAARQVFGAVRIRHPEKDLPV
jgi:hypothetical protein